MFSVCKDDIKCNISLPLPRCTRVRQAINPLLLPVAVWSWDMLVILFMPVLLSMNSATGFSGADDVVFGAVLQGSKSA